MTKLQTGERGLFEVILDVGGCPQCVTVTTFCRSIVPLPRIALPNVSYEERSDDVGVAGNVRDALKKPLSQVTVTLARWETGPVYSTTTNQRGEFQFRDTDPGKYTLKVTRESYSTNFTFLWVARENLTRIDRLDLYLLQWEACAPEVESESSVLPKELTPPQ
jgi:hypothetical protein